MDPKKCPKCGREAAENMAFCTECLAEMEKYPVKPGVVVLLPRQEKGPKPIRRRHAAAHPEDQIQKLKQKISALTLALLIALSAAGILGWMAAADYFSQTDMRLPGQNYSSDNPATPQEIK